MVYLQGRGKLSLETMGPILDDRMKRMSISQFCHQASDDNSQAIDAHSWIDSATSSLAQSFP